MPILKREPRNENFSKPLILILNLQFPLQIIVWFNVCFQKKKLYQIKVALNDRYRDSSVSCNKNSVQYLILNEYKTKIS